MKFITSSGDKSPVLIGTASLGHVNGAMRRVESNLSRLEIESISPSLLLLFSLTFKFA